MRWSTPILLLAVAVYVWHYNGAHTDRKLLFPAVELVVGPDVQTQSELSWMLFAGLGIASGVVILARRPREA